MSDICKTLGSSLAPHTPTAKNKYWGTPHTLLGIPHFSSYGPMDGKPLWLDYTAQEREGAEKVYLFFPINT